MPWLALATLALALALLAAGLAREDAAFVKMRATIGGVAFAAILAAGAAMRPSLLRRSLGYKLRMDAAGWQRLHVAWIALALLLAAANEVVRRSTSDATWAIYHAVAGPVAFALVYLLTRVVATRHWEKDG